MTKASQVLTSGMQVEAKAKKSTSTQSAPKKSTAKKSAKKATTTKSS